MKYYLDNSATTPLAPETAGAMDRWRATSFANASSVHRAGQTARVAIETARDAIAEYIGAKPREVVFTSGGTESNNFALKGYCFRVRRETGEWPTILIPPTEHHAILEPARYLESLGAQLTSLAVDRSGRVSPDELRVALRSARRVVPPMVSIMHANNETGSLNPIPALAAVAREEGAVMHTDAVQSFGKILTDVNSLGIDMMTISAHKIHGPKGIGALYLSREIEIDALIHGGSQERNRRGGTEPVEVIVGFEAAVRLVSAADRERYAAVMTALARELRSGLATIEGVQFVTPDHDTLPSIVSITFDDAANLDGEGLIVGLDLEGIAVSNGAACTSGSIQPSHVLAAIGLPSDQARVAVRFSLSRYTTSDELRGAVEALRKVVTRMRKAGPRTVAM